MPRARTYGHGRGRSVTSSSRFRHDFAGSSGGTTRSKLAPKSELTRSVSEERSARGAPTAAREAGQAGATGLTTWSAAETALSAARNSVSTGEKRQLFAGSGGGCMVAPGKGNGRVRG